MTEILSGTRSQTGKLSGTLTSKGLSSNDYTTAEKNKLRDIDPGAQVNVLESVKVNGMVQTITDKAVDITVPTATSQLTNDSGYITSAEVPEGAAASTVTPKMDGAADRGTDNGFARGDHIHPTDTSRASADDLAALTTRVGTAESKLDGIEVGATKTSVDTAISSSSTNPVQNKAISSALSLKAPLASPTFTGVPKAPTADAGTDNTQIATTAFVKTAITNAIAGVTSITYNVVTALPASGENGVIYLVAHSHGDKDAYDEYIWTGTSFEKLGNTDIDLSGYMLKSDMVAITTSEIDAMFA